MENVLEKLNKTSISVTDIANQFWCEKQLELSYLYGRESTEEMKKGKQIHEELQEEVFVPLEVEPVTYADALYKVAYENYMALKTLKEKGVCRELQIYGSINGYRVIGKIDELKIEKGKAKVIEVKTFGKSNSVITNAKAKTHIVQVMLYRKLLEELKNKAYSLGDFIKAYGIGEKRLSEQFLRGLHELGLKEEFASLSSMTKMMFEEFYSLPELSNELEIRYIDRFTGEQTSTIIIKYDEKKISNEIRFAFEYWNGKREAMPVSKEEAWKCKLCRFYGKECKVWYDGAK